MPIRLLAGVNTLGEGTAQVAYDITYLWSFSVDIPGFAKELRLYTPIGADAKVAIYDYPSPHNLMEDLGIVSCSDLTWNVIPLAGIDLSASSNIAVSTNGDTLLRLTRYVESGYLKYKSETYGTWSFPDPNNLIGYSSRNRQLCAGLWGWINPTISSVNYSVIYDGQIGITLTGTDFMDSGTILELCNGPVYATATKVSQTVTAQTDTTLVFTAAKGSLGQGIHYLFVTTSIGLRNAVGYSISLRGNYGMNLPQQGDVWFFDGSNGGDIEVESGIARMTKFIESAVYICWFGGNFRDDGSEATKKLQWCGNEGEPVSRQHRSRLQSMIFGNPLTSAQLPRIEEAAVADLKNGLPGSLISEISVSAFASAPKRVDLTANIVTKSGTPYEVNVGVDL